MKTKQQAKAHLLKSIKFFRFAIKAAQKDGNTVKLGILSVAPDGSGKVEMQFDHTEFFEDLEVLVGAPSYTDKDEMDAQALQFLQKLGLKD
jgi:hypothetical protein